MWQPFATDDSVGEGPAVDALASAEGSNVLALLEDYRAGRAGALDRLIPLIYADLRRIARRHVRQWGELTLDTTALVHEAYLKLAGQRAVSALDRVHFLAICGRAMRQFIVSYARRKHAIKRNDGIAPIGLDEPQVSIDADAEQLVLIDQALAKLASIDERLVRVFECRFFAGLSDEETMAALGRPLRSVQRDWMRARAWIKELLESGAGA